MKLLLHVFVYYNTFAAVSFSYLRTVTQAQCPSVPHWITKRCVVLSTTWRRKNGWTYPLILHRRILIRKLGVAEMYTVRHRAHVQTFAADQISKLSLLNPEIYGGDVLTSCPGRLNPSVDIFLAAVWDPQPVWTFWRRGKSLSHADNWTTIPRFIWHFYKYIPVYV